MATEETQAPPPEQTKPRSETHQDDNAQDGRREKNDNGGRGRLMKIALVLVVIFGILFVIGVLPRLSRNRGTKAAAKSQQDLTPSVSIVNAQAPSASDVLTLPGNIQAIQQTSVTARASGYIQRWLVDIGDRVRQGQTLAIISTPDVQQEVVQARAQVAGSQAAEAQAKAGLSDQRANLVQTYAELSRSDATLAQARTQLAQAQAAVAQAQQQSAQQQAQLVQAQANLNLARVTAQRYENLLAEGAIDRQTTDQTVASYQTNFANVQALASSVRAGQANVVAYRDAVGSSRANVAAYAEGVKSSRAQVTAGEANVRSAAANVTAAAANVRSAQANLSRLAVLQGFNRVTAPFSGIITARNVDNGALISASGDVSDAGGSTVGSGSAGSSSSGNAAGGSATGSGSSPGLSPTGSGAGGGNATSLFSIAQTNVLRIYISVPAADADEIRPGQDAQVLSRDLPGHPFVGEVTRTASALDPNTRTLVTEVDIKNPQDLLRPGMFANVRLRVPHPGGALLIPDSALLTLAPGTEALVLNSGNKVHYQPITVGRDFGQVIEVLSGLRPGEQVIANPNDSLREGETVHPAPAAPAAQGG